MNTNFKTFIESPWIRIVQMLTTAIVALFMYFVVTAKDDLKQDILDNKNKIEANEIQLKDVQIEEAKTTMSLEYIKKTLDEVRDDVKAIREEK